jgi:hypothetical protein
VLVADAAARRDGRALSAALRSWAALDFGSRASPWWDLHEVSTPGKGIRGGTPHTGARQMRASERHNGVPRYAPTRLLPSLEIAGRASTSATAGTKEVYFKAHPRATDERP